MFGLQAEALQVRERLVVVTTFLCSLHLPVFLHLLLCQALSALQVRERLVVVTTFLCSLHLPVFLHLLLCQALSALHSFV